MAPRFCTLALVTAAAAVPRSLPAGPLIAGYATACGPRTLRAAADGVNVLFWFSSSLAFNDSTGLPFVAYGGPDLACVANVSLALRAAGLPTAHFMTFGGWDAPHPSTRASAAATYAAWAAWQRDVVARPGLEGGFDGIDWDLEGNDNATSSFNVLDVAVLNLVGEFSARAKADGFLVSMVPAESYLDPATAPLFDRSLLHAYPDGWQPNFTYHGRNGYAYLLSRFPVFDVVLLQTYETFSHLDFAVQHGEPPVEYLRSFVPALAAGWFVDFGSDVALGWPSGRVAVPPARLLVGFGNAWAAAAPGTPPNATRNTLVLPAEVGVAHAALGMVGMAPRGYF